DRREIGGVISGIFHRYTLSPLSEPGPVADAPAASRIRGWPDILRGELHSLIASHVVGYLHVVSAVPERGNNGAREGGLQVDLPSGFAVNTRSGDGFLKRHLEDDNVEQSLEHCADETATAGGANRNPWPSLSVNERGASTAHALAGRDRVVISTKGIEMP